MQVFDLYKNHEPKCPLIGWSLLPVAHLKLGWSINVQIQLFESQLYWFVRIGTCRYKWSRVCINSQSVLSDSQEPSFTQHTMTSLSPYILRRLTHGSQAYYPLPAAALAGWLAQWLRDLRAVFEVHWGREWKVMDLCVMTCFTWTLPLSVTPALLRSATQILIVLFQSRQVLTLHPFCLPPLCFLFISCMILYSPCVFLLLSSRLWRCSACIIPDGEAAV